ncbi:mitogen-activated protein kinase organizer 1 [Salpingoeca rosetta]|uniref:Mitogen-activated protein kinase organizer 1 n=1 Tax=Salpingoeca rosetta (strain ATCC 50818 / BSB-021) TaxID=946362 RepID=F2TWM0_SALR5|nr:mitogen-activated protein kinase organizer 1 [Salpingoeca rosetta]EGD72466.1 mitogen-activated protein kinase organizer 1 [Salpingoeca rosetta]|eukprot:XP_004999035.1 mitogen-activated protein kinase organizer 1 [Salpingoeca rosetta]
MATSGDRPTKCVGTLDGHVGPVMAVRFNVDGQYCLTCGKDRLVKLWNPHTQMLIKTYQGHGFEVNDACASPGNSTFLSCSADKMVIYWDVASGKPIRKYRAHGQRINCIRLNEEGTVAVSGSYDATAKLWDLRSSSREPIQTLSEAKDSIPAVDVSDHEILTAAVDGHVRRYDIRMGRMYQDRLSDAVTSARFSNDNNCILAATLDSNIRLLDKDDGKMLARYEGHKNTDYKVDCTLSFDDAVVVGGSEDGRIVMWDLVKKTMLADFKADSSVICSLAYHPSKHLLLSASTGGKVQVWAPP